MKSVGVTFLMFIVVFAVIKVGALDIIDTRVFRIGSWVIFASVFAAAVYFVGLPSFGDKTDNDEQNIDHDETNMSKKSQKEITDDTKE